MYPFTSAGLKTQGASLEILYLHQADCNVPTTPENCTAGTKRATGPWSGNAVLYDPPEVKILYDIISRFPNQITEIEYIPVTYVSRILSRINHNITTSTS